MSKIFPVLERRAWERAGPTDLIELPVPDNHPIYVAKSFLQMLVAAITGAEMTHLSGPSGTAKSALIEALHLHPETFPALCAGMQIEPRPLVVHTVETATYESPGELFFRRAVKDGCTWDEPSRLVEAIESATRAKEEYPLIWLREIGRCHASAVQGGLLNLMVRGEIALPDGRRLDGRGIAWLADSNYQAVDDLHTLVAFDDALRRRFSVNLTLDHLGAEQEMAVLLALLGQEGAVHSPERALIASVVKLGAQIRHHRAEGQLSSAVPPTLYGYLAFLRMARALPQTEAREIARHTLLGNISTADRQLAQGILSEVWGLNLETEVTDTVGATF